MRHTRSLLAVTCLLAATVLGVAGAARAHAAPRHRVDHLNGAELPGETATATRLDTVEASLPEFCTVLNATTAALGQRVSVIEANLNTPDTGLFARVGTLHSALCLTDRATLVLDDRGHVTGVMG